MEDLDVATLKARLRALCQTPRSRLKQELRQQLQGALRSQAGGQLEPTASKAVLRARLEEWGLPLRGASKAALQEQVTEAFRSISAGELDLPLAEADVAGQDASLPELRAQLEELCQKPRSKHKAALQEQLAAARRAQERGALEVTGIREVLLRRIAAWGLEPLGMSRASRAVLRAQVEQIFRRIAAGEDLEDIRTSMAATRPSSAVATTDAQAGASQVLSPVEAPAPAPVPAAAPAPAAPSHVLVVLSGLQGSGKSTLSKLLGSIFGGTLWLNQDEIGEARSAKTFREGVRATLEAVAADSSPRLVLIDKMNHRQEHRQFLFQQVEETRWRERGGRLLLVQLLPDQGSWDLDHLQGRIEARGDAHHTLRPSSELREILERTAQDAEPMSEEELGRFDEALALPDSFPTASKAVSVAGSLYKLGWASALEWRHRLLGAPLASGAELPGLPPWVRVLPLNPKASETPDAGKGDWDALGAFFAAELQRLQKEEEDWRNKGD